MTDIQRLCNNNYTRRPRVLVGTADTRVLEHGVTANEEYVVNTIPINSVFNRMYAVYRDGDSALSDINLTITIEGFGDVTATLASGAGDRAVEVDISGIQNPITTSDVNISFKSDVDIPVGKVQIITEFVDIEEIEGSRVRIKPKEA